MAGSKPLEEPKPIVIPEEREAREIAVIIAENSDGKTSEELAMEMYDWVTRMIRKRN